jgi:hypothetical protein
MATVQVIGIAVTGIQITNIEIWNSNYVPVKLNIRFIVFAIPQYLNSKLTEFA